MKKTIEQIKEELGIDNIEELNEILQELEEGHEEVDEEVNEWRYSNREEANDWRF